MNRSVLKHKQAQCNQEPEEAALGQIGEGLDWQVQDWPDSTIRRICGLKVSVLWKLCGRQCPVASDLCHC